MAEHSSAIAAPNVDVVAGLRDLAGFLEAHPELPTARIAFVQLRCRGDQQPARETLAMLARELGENATEQQNFTGDVEIRGKFGPCSLVASASVAELRDIEPMPLAYEPIVAGQTA